LPAPADVAPARDDIGVRFVRAEAGSRRSGLPGGIGGFWPFDGRPWTVERRLWTVDCRLRTADREPFELRADGLAGGDALRARDVVPLRVAREKAVARAAEPLPDRLGSRFLDRADRPPLGLELLDLGRRAVPVGR